MRVSSAPFGGILVETARGNIAVNGGGELAELDGFYLAEGRPVPAAIVLTTEHLHRSHGVEAFADSHDIPLAGPLLALAYLHSHSPKRWEVIPPRRLAINGIGLEFFHIRYDSLDPVALTVSSDGETLGVVTDGRLTERDTDALERLKSCQKIFFGNKLDTQPEGPRLLKLRCRGFYNTSAELAELFQDYRGEMIVDPNCR
jgi:hypothetical protein